jgi:NADH:ubiquinone oxidoreductase subunit E
MLIIQICVGSACHIRGSAEIVELFEKNIEKYGLQDDTVLAGSLCIGKCNRIGVTVQINDEIFTGITRDNFGDFFKEHVLDVIERERF